MIQLVAEAQTIQPGENVVFTLNPVPDRGILVRLGGVIRRFWLARWRQGTGSVLLNGRLPLFGRACCCNQPAIGYPVSFHGNIAVPTGGTVEAIQLAVAIDGATDPASVMTYTPAEVETFGNVGTAITAEVWQGCCETVAVRNISAQPITLSNGVLNIDTPLLGR